MGICNSRVELVRERPALQAGPDPESNLRNNKWVPFALWDAESNDSLAWRQTAAVFLSTLITFAITLYLLGQGLSMGRSGAATMLIGLGAVLSCVAFMLALGAALRPLGTELAVVMPSECHLDEEQIREGARGSPSESGALLRDRQGAR